MKNNSLRILTGTERPEEKPWPFFSDTVVDFLETLSHKIRLLPADLLTPELMSAAFWLRRSHLLKMKQAYENQLRMGLGLSFDITPANVPYLFLYSMALALLAGNSCVVRVSSRQLDSVLPICNLLKEIFDFSDSGDSNLGCSKSGNSDFGNSDFQEMSHRIAIITYDHDESALTASYSAQCDVRIIWGGDASINQIRAYPIKPTASELVFPDRHAICLLSADVILTLSEIDLAELAHRFCNDTYAMDQNACACPKLIFWQESTVTTGQAAAKRFWSAIAAEVTSDLLPADLLPSSPLLAPIKISQKYGALMSLAATCETIDHFRHFGNALYVCESSVPPSPTICDHLLFGSFVEYHMTVDDDWTKSVSPRTQTVTTFGIDTASIAQAVLTHHLPGVHRIVPVGQALMMTPVWDGKDMLLEMSRRIMY